MLLILCLAALTTNSLPLPVVPVLGFTGMIFPSSSCWVLTYLVFLSSPYTAFSYHGGNDWRGKVMSAINTKPALWLHKAISPRVLRTPSLYCESCGCLLCKTRVKPSSWCSEPFSPTQLPPPPFWWQLSLAQLFKKNSKLKQFLGYYVSASKANTDGQDKEDHRHLSSLCITTVLLPILPLSCQSFWMSVRLSVCPLASSVLASILCIWYFSAFFPKQ